MVLQVARERLVQQRLLQFVERGELVLAEGFETLRFRREFTECGNDGVLLSKRCWK